MTPRTAFGDPSQSSSCTIHNTRNLPCSFARTNRIAQLEAKPVNVGRIVQAFRQATCVGLSTMEPSCLQVQWQHVQTFSRTRLPTSTRLQCCEEFHATMGSSFLGHSPCSAGVRKWACKISASPAARKLYCLLVVAMLGCTKYTERQLTAVHPHRRIPENNNVPHRMPECANMLDRLTVPCLSLRTQQGMRLCTLPRHEKQLSPERQCAASETGKREQAERLHCTALWT